MLDVEDKYVAYCLDEAVAAWGNFVESELGKVEGKTQQETEQKQLSKLDQLLGREPQKGRFADPANLFT